MRKYLNSQGIETSRIIYYLLLAEKYSEINSSNKFKMIKDFPELPELVWSELCGN